MARAETGAGEPALPCAPLLRLLLLEPRAAELLLLLLLLLPPAPPAPWLRTRLDK